VKKLLPIVKVQNGGFTQDCVENVYIFHPKFLKMIFFFNFSLLWVKIKLLWKNFFLENSKWRENLMWKMIFFQKFQDFIIAQQ
jgi:hypothetical protein